MLKSWHIPPRRVVLWHAVSAVPLALIVVLGAYLSYHYHALSTESRERAERAYEVVDQVDALLVAVEDADVAERDFIITGRAENLSGFQAAVKATEVNRLALLQKLQGSHEQLARFVRLEQAVAGKTTEMGGLVTLRQAEGFDAARTVVAREDDQQLMERVRSEAQGLIAEERHILTLRQQAAREHERHILLAGGLIAGLSVCIRLTIALVVSRLRKRAARVKAAV